MLDIDEVWEVMTPVSIALAEVLEESGALESVFVDAMANEDAAPLAPVALAEAWETAVSRPEVMRELAPPTPAIPPCRGTI